jgi:hypothetical protein
MLPHALISAFLLCLGTFAAQAQSAAPLDTAGLMTIRNRGLVIEGETIICPGSITALKVKGQYASYQWSTGHQSPNITVFKPGTYGVTVTTSGGCALTGSVTVRYSDSPCL